MLNADEVNANEDVSAISEVTNLTSNLSLSSTKKKLNANDNNQCNVDAVTIDMLDSITNEIFTKERSELKFINRKSSEIAIQLLV